MRGIKFRKSGRGNTSMPQGFDGGVMVSHQGYVQEIVGEGQDLGSEGIDEADVSALLELRCKSDRHALEGRFNGQIHHNEFYLKKDQEQFDDIHNRYSEFVEAEKFTLPGRSFFWMDVFGAVVEWFKSRMAEQDKFKPESSK